ncbi:hypothetical protein MIR68_006979 [Amoeboaphelidium protococcarum]|nr:hypothetical protein MIR68_006979 [Amoeboaphelidium protococcarum]
MYKDPLRVMDLESLDIQLPQDITPAYSYIHATMPQSSGDNLNEQSQWTRLSLKCIQYQSSQQDITKDLVKVPMDIRWRLYLANPFTRYLDLFQLTDKDRERQVESINKRQSENSKIKHEQDDDDLVDFDDFLTGKISSVKTTKAVIESAPLIFQSKKKRQKTKQ